MVVQTGASQILHVDCAKRRVPCPNCGRKARRIRTCTRTVTYPVYGVHTLLQITYGEYRANCGCCKTFRNSPPGVSPKAQHHHRLHRIVLDRILQDGLSVRGTIDSIERDFFIKLSPGFIYDVFRQEAQCLDSPRYHRQILRRFSGVLCCDELHLGAYTLLLATDPLADLVVGYALVETNNQEQMRLFLDGLRNRGFQPNTVVSDGSNLYPGVLKELWPEAKHQLCLFHVIQDINDLVLVGVRRLRNKMRCQANKGRRKGKGRPNRAALAARRRQGVSKKDQSAFVFKHRFLITKRGENMTSEDRENLATMLSYLPELADFRRFTERLHWLMGKTTTSRRQAWARRAVLLKDKEFGAIPELAKAMKQLSGEKFKKLVVYLDAPGEKQVRTNNHVERANRWVRLYEKVRYKWRRGETLDLFLNLMIHRDWQQKLTDDSGQCDSTPVETAKPKLSAA